jgi:hypothetical protein
MPNDLDLCAWCEEPVLVGERIARMTIQREGHARRLHHECEFRSVMGGANHIRGTCTCCGGKGDPDPHGMSKRQAAMAAMDAWHEMQPKRTWLYDEALHTFRECTISATDRRTGEALSSQRAPLLLEIWTVYDHPKDWPQFFVARKFILDKPTKVAVFALTLEGIQSQMRARGLVRLERNPADDPVIVECWL